MNRSSSSAFEEPEWTAEQCLGAAADNAGAFAEAHYGVTRRDTGFIAEATPDT